MFVSGEVSPDQVKDGSENCMGKWLYHLTILLSAVSCLCFFSGELLCGLTQG
jgi:hypothetical protein